MSYIIGQGDGEFCDERWLFQRVRIQVEMHRVGNEYELFLYMHLVQYPWGCLIGNKLFMKTFYVPLRSLDYIREPILSKATV